MKSTETNIAKKTSITTTMDGPKRFGFMLFGVVFGFFGLWATLAPIEGAAFASAFSVVIYNMIKFLIIKIKFKMQPYDLNALKILLIISLTFIIGYVLPSFDFTIFSMIFRSVIVSIIYVSLVYLFRIVPEFDKYFKLKF